MPELRRLFGNTTPKMRVEDEDHRFAYISTHEVTDHEARLSCEEADEVPDVCPYHCSCPEHIDWENSLKRGHAPNIPGVMSERRTLAEVVELRPKTHHNESA